MKSITRAAAFAAAVTSTGLGLAAPGIHVETKVPLTASQQQALVNTDPAVLANFPLARTVGQILRYKRGAAADTAANRELWVSTMLANFTKTQFRNPVTNILETVPAQPNVAVMSPTAVLDPNNQTDGFKPIELTLRFDLAPADGAHCGEYRITYAKNSGLTDAFNRMTIIFEGAIPNPTPAEGIAGCLPVAQFMASLETKTPAELAAPLEQLYYTGLPNTAGKPGFFPVVTFNNYGRPYGQIRTNVFVLDQVWKMYEFTSALRADILDPIGQQAVGVNSRPLADSARIDLYGLPKTGENSALTTLRTQFQNDLISTYLPNVYKLDIDANTVSPPKVVTDIQLFSGISAGIAPQYLSFVGNSNDPKSNINFTDPNTGETVTDPALRSRVITATRALPTAWLPSTNDGRDPLNRLTAASCVGCHQVAARFKIARTDVDSFPGIDPELLTVRFPRPFGNGFVHTSETGILSEFKQIALPHRYGILHSFITSQTGPNNLAVQSMPSTLSIDTVQTNAVAEARKANLPEKDTLLLRAQTKRLPGPTGQPRPVH